jgi:hypothetical protein
MITGPSETANLLHRAFVSISFPHDESAVYLKDLAGQQGGRRPAGSGRDVARPAVDVPGASPILVSLCPTAASLAGPSIRCPRCQQAVPPTRTFGAEEPAHRDWRVSSQLACRSISGRATVGKIARSVRVEVRAKLLLRQEASEGLATSRVIA